MEIKAADVMKLRKMTGAGMMDCKKALIEAEGDYARAQDIIREKGKLVVAKRAERNASEGVVVTRIVGTKAYMLCLACETDFVAQNAEFAASADAMIEVAVAADAADKDALLAVKNAEGHTVEEMVTEKSGQTGEKVELAFYARIGRSRGGGSCSGHAGYGDGSHRNRRRRLSGRRGCPRASDRYRSDEAGSQECQQARGHSREDRRRQDAQVLRGEYAAEPGAGR